MGARINEMADTVSAPQRGHVYQDATSTTTAYLDLDTTVDGIPAYFRNRYLTVQAIGSDLVVALTKLNTDTIDPTANQSGGTPPVNGCVYIFAGQERAFFPGPDGSLWRYLAFRAATAAGRIVIFASSPKELHKGRR